MSQERGQRVKSKYFIGMASVPNKLTYIHVAVERKM